MPDQLAQQSVLGSQVVKTEALLKWVLISRRAFLSFALHSSADEERPRKESKRSKGRRVESLDMALVF